jgi:hypothetical protein
VADVAEKELEKRGNWDAIYTPAIEEIKKAKRKAWEETKKGVGEVKRSNLEQMRKKVEAYRQLGMALPQSEIDRELADPLFGVLCMCIMFAKRSSMLVVGMLQ